MLQSSLAVVPVALREHRVGSLPLSQAGCTKQGPPSLSLPSFEGTMVQGKRKRPTLNRGPKMTQQHVPTWSLFRPHRTTLKKRPALKKKTWCHTEELALLLHFKCCFFFLHRAKLRGDDCLWAYLSCLSSRYPSRHRAKSHYLAGKAIWQLVQLQKNNNSSTTKASHCHSLRALLTWKTDRPSVLIRNQIEEKKLLKHLYREHNKQGNAQKDIFTWCWLLAFTILTICAADVLIFYNLQKSNMRQLE